MENGSSITLFSFLTNILRLKSRSVYEKHVEDESFDTLYVPFMVTKWCSMVRDGSVADALASNQLALDLLSEDKRMHYMLLMNVLPKVDETPRWAFDKKKR